MDGWTSLRGSLYTGHLRCSLHMLLTVLRELGIEPAAPQPPTVPGLEGSESQVWKLQSPGASSDAFSPFPEAQRLWSPWLGVRG